MKATKNNYLFLLIAILFTINGYGQQRITEIKTGERMPDMMVSGIMNKNIKQINLKELYQNAPLIIDFWFTSCVPCIKEMKFLDSLKAQHPGKFNVLMVTYQKEAEIKAFLNRANNKDVKTSNLYLATADSILKKMFPHRVAPHNIWIDKQGVVRAITGTEEVTAANVLSFANQENSLKMRQKKDILNFEPMEEFHLMDTSFSYRSIITPAIPTGSSGSLAGTSKELAYNRFFQYNTSISHLFWTAFSIYNKNPLGTYRENLVEIHTKDSLRLLYPFGKHVGLLQHSPYKNLQDWNKDNTYCYALTLPNRIPDTLFRDYLFSDLERYFQVHPKIEKRERLCTVVSKTKGEALNPAEANQGAYAKIKFTDGKLQIRNAKIQDVVNYFFTIYDNRTLNHPFVTEIPDSEQYRFDLDLDFNGNKALDDGISPEDYFQMLSRYGFRFEQKLRPYPILVLYDLKSNK